MIAREKVVMMVFLTLCVNDEEMNEAVGLSIQAFRKRRSRKGGRSAVSQVTSREWYISFVVYLIGDLGVPKCVVGRCSLFDSTLA